MTKEQIAEVAYETQRAYCRTIGDNSQPIWENAPDWQRDGAIGGVLFHINYPDAGCSCSHEIWRKMKQAEGWKYGEVEDPVKKEHPCCVPYDELPAEQRVKDALLVGVVRILKVLL